MLASDTRVTRVNIKHQDSQSIIYQASLSTLLEVKRQLQAMAENGEIDLTTVELNRSLGRSMQKLIGLLNQQITAADLWQAEEKCPQCNLRLMPLVETCVCGCKSSKSDRLEIDDLSFLIAENCTE